MFWIIAGQNVTRSDCAQSPSTAHGEKIPLSTIFTIRHTHHCFQRYCHTFIVFIFPPVILLRKHVIKPYNGYKCFQNWIIDTLPPRGFLSAPRSDPGASKIWQMMKQEVRRLQMLKLIMSSTVIRCHVCLKNLRRSVLFNSQTPDDALKSCFVLLLFTSSLRLMQTEYRRRVQRPGGWVSIHFCFTADWLRCRCCHAAGLIIRQPQTFIHTHTHTNP